MVTLNLARWTVKGHNHTFQIECYPSNPRLRDSFRAHRCTVVIPKWEKKVATYCREAVELGP